MNREEEKQTLRKVYAQRRALLQSAEKDAQICRKFLSLFSEERNFFVYCAFRTEVATEEIIRALQNKGACVCVPKLSGKEMFAVPLSGNTAFNRFGISEPISGADTHVDVAAVPLLAVDEEGYRLGYGGGYYDRYFQTHPHVFRVGLCYAGQAVETPLPRESTDIPLHAIVTEEGVRFFPQRLDSENPFGV